MRAAFSHSKSRVAGQKASRRTLPWMMLPVLLFLALAALTLILAMPLAPLFLLPPMPDWPGHEKKPPPPPAADLLVAVEPPLFEFLLSHEGRKAETRCMVWRVEGGGRKTSLRRRRAGQARFRAGQRGRSVARCGVDSTGAGERGGMACGEKQSQLTSPASPGRTMGDGESVSVCVRAPGQGVSDPRRGLQVLATGTCSDGHLQRWQVVVVPRKGPAAWVEGGWSMLRCLPAAALPLQKSDRGWVEGRGKQEGDGLLFSDGPPTLGPCRGGRIGGFWY